MLSTLLLYGFVSTILASAILSRSLDGYLDGYLDGAFDTKGELSMKAFETFTPDTAGSIDWSVGPAEDKISKQDGLKPTPEEPCPRLHCLCSKIQQYYTLIQISEADPCKSPPLSPQNDLSIEQEELMKYA